MCVDIVQVALTILLQQSTSLDHLKVLGLAAEEFLDVPQEINVVMIQCQSILKENVNGYFKHNSCSSRA